jgi:predicted tellurium resistance membrane protein TerC
VGPGGRSAVAWLPLSAALDRWSVHAWRSGSALLGPHVVGRVAIIELADFAFALDSVLIAVALSEHLWVIYTGAAIGIAAMRFAAGLTMALLVRFPQIEVAAYTLVGWAATKLLLSAQGESTLLRSTDTVPESLMPQWLFWLGAILIITAGTCLAYGAGRDRGSPKSGRKCAATFIDRPR